MNRRVVCTLVGLACAASFAPAQSVVRAAPRWTRTRYVRTVPSYSQSRFFSPRLSPAQEFWINLSDAIGNFGAAPVPPPAFQIHIEDGVILSREQVARARETALVRAYLSTSVHQSAVFALRGSYTEHYWTATQVDDTYPYPPGELFLMPQMIPSIRRGTVRGMSVPAWADPQALDDMSDVLDGTDAAGLDSPTRSTGGPDWSRYGDWDRAQSDDYIFWENQRELDRIQGARQDAPFAGPHAPSPRGCVGGPGIPMQCY